MLDIVKQFDRHGSSPHKTAWDAFRKAHKHPSVQGKITGDLCLCNPVEYMQKKVKQIKGNS